MASVPTSSHGSSGAAGDETLLSTTTLAVDGTFDVTGISGAYNDLRLVLIVRGTRAAAVNDFCQMRLNNDSGGNYDSEFVLNGTATNVFSATSGRLSASMPAATATANAFGMIELFIPAYAATAKLKVCRFLGSHPLTIGSSDFTEQGMCVWNSTAAITRVGFFGGTTANLLTGSQLRIYGVT